VSIEVAALGHAKWHMIMRFKNVGVLKLPVEREMERVVEGIEG